MILKQGKSIYFMQEVHAMDLMFSVIGHYQPLFLVLVLDISERCNQYCKKSINNVISSDYNIINCFHDKHNY